MLSNSIKYQTNIFFRNVSINFKLVHSNYKYFSTKTKLDPYLILEVNRSADWKTIKLAYFKLARLYHPDLNKNDEVI
jgi:hypothetical protein